MILGRDDVPITYSEKPKKDKTHVKTKSDKGPKVIRWVDVKPFLSPNSVRVAERAIEVRHRSGYVKQIDPEKAVFHMYKHNPQWGSLYCIDGYRVPTLLRVINGTKRKAKGLDRNNGKYKVYWLLVPGVASHGGVISAVAWTYGLTHYDLECYDIIRT